MAEHFFEGDVYAFIRDPRGLTVLREHLARELGVDGEQIRVVGSGKIGFSVSPADFPRPFSTASDIDIVIVNDRMYDAIWHSVLEGQYARKGRVPGDEWRSTRTLYWGWIAPDRVRFDVLTMPPSLAPAQRLAARWFNAFRSLSRYRQFSRREVSGRLYRTWQHASLYHVDGLRELARALGGEA